MLRRIVVLVAIVSSALGGAAVASPSASAAAAQSSERAAASPRAALAAYLELCRSNRFEDASDYLQLSESQRNRGAELAERLKRVLDRRAWLDLDSMSAAPAGSTSDGLPPNLEQVASIAGPLGQSQPVQLVRMFEGEDARWIFSSSTVARIDAWYESLEQKWIFEHLPTALLRPGPLEILWWQWLALPVWIASSWLFGAIAGRLARGSLRRIARRTKAEWDNALLERMSGPLTLAGALVGAFLTLPLIGLYPPAETTLNRAARAVALLCLFWALLRALGVGASLLASSARAQVYPASRALIPLGSRILKVVVSAVALVAVLAELGYPVASLIAGLGIGGLALALAAQKTVENLFGAFSIGIDQPFREGDFVRVEDFVGTVESIGLRSTKIRTLDRTLISIPNGRLAEMRLESFTARDRIRLYCTIGVVYETTAAQMREILSGFERVLREHPKIWPDAVIVRFKEFAASSLDIEIMAWFVTQDFGEFQALRQDVLLSFMQVVEQAGSSFAFPTRTLHLAGGGPGVPTPRPREHHGDGKNELHTAKTARDVVRGTRR